MTNNKAKKYFSKNTIPTGSPFKSGIGAKLCDINGNTFIDLCSQTLNTNLGQCHQVVNNAVIEALQNITYSSSRYSNIYAIKLAEKLVAIAPNNLVKVNLKNVSGSLANENALKAVRKRTGKTNIISIKDSHLGQSFETMRISGKNFDKSYLQQRNTFFLKAPYCYRCPFGKQKDTCKVECLNDLENFKNKDIAAIFMESIMVDAGVLIPPDKYHSHIKEFCLSNNIALVIDEVQTGFGWLGDYFASLILKLQPDILTLGKGIGAGFPLADVLLSEEYDVLDYGEHEITYGAHPISCAASLAMINYLSTEGLHEAKEKGEYFQSKLSKLKSIYPIIGDIRAIGLLIGIEFIDANNNPNSKITLAIYKELFSVGIITRISKVGENCNILQIKPPIVISYSEIDEALNKLKFVLKKINNS